MPNWVFNSVQITDSPEKIFDIVALLAKPYESRHAGMAWNEEKKTFEHSGERFMVEEVFSFWNIKKPDDLESYFTVANSENMHKEGNWYNWNVLNWGTKWEACNPEIIEHEHDLVLYRFDTAWSPPLPAIKALSEQFPSAKITIEYQEEGGWGGVYTFRGGEVVMSSEYDAPPYEEDEDEEMELSRQA